MRLTNVQALIIILVVSLGTQMTRWLPFLLFPESKQPPKVVLYLGKVLPPAMMGLLVVYCFKNVTWLSGAHGAPELLASAAVVGLHLWKRNVLFSIAGGPDLTLTEVSEAARTVEACADENANIIYGQIIDEELKDAVRITVIATGFKVGAAQSSMDFAPRKDLFASHEPAPQPVQQAPVTFSAPAPTSRFTDEDYIPDFLKRAR